MTDHLSPTQFQDSDPVRAVVDPSSHNTNPAAVFEGTGFTWT